MKKNIKKIVGVIACVTLLCAMTGCAMLDSAINDLKGSLIGNGYVIDTYLSRKDLMQKLIFSRKISTAIQMAALQTIHILPVS